MTISSLPSGTLLPATSCAVAADRQIIIAEPPQIHLSPRCAARKHNTAVTSRGDLSALAVTCATLRRICRSPHIILSAAAITACQHNAAVRTHNAAVVPSWGPFRACGHLRPCYAVIRRSPHIILLVTSFPTSHQYDAAIGECHGAGLVPCRPSGTCVHSRPRCAFVRRSPDIVFIVAAGRNRPFSHDATIGSATLA